MKNSGLKQTAKDWPFSTYIHTETPGTTKADNTDKAKGGGQRMTVCFLIASVTDVVLFSYFFST